MEFSIIIPTVNNYNYFKLSLDSIKKNSTYGHEIIVHLNGDDTETENLLLKNSMKYTKSDTNIGLCSGVNLACKETTKNYIVYAHDDMYFLPKWDKYLADEISKLKTDKFYLSSTQISSNKPLKNSLTNHIYYDCGDNINNFDEKKILDNFEKLDFYDLQGSHWAPHIVSKSLWNDIGGFSEEFNPGFGSDPDLNMKLWENGVRIFKGVNKSRIYHFGSQTTRKNKDLIRNNANKTFLLKWGISINYFTKYYMRRGEKYNGELKNPKISLFSFFELASCLIKYFYFRIVSKK